MVVIDREVRSKSVSGSLGSSASAPTRLELRTRCAPSRALVGVPDSTEEDTFRQLPCQQTHLSCRASCRGKVDNR